MLEVGYVCMCVCVCVCVGGCVCMWVGRWVCGCVCVGVCGCVWVVEWFALWALNRKVVSSSPSVGMIIIFPSNDVMVIHQIYSPHGHQSIQL